MKRLAAFVFGMFVVMVAAYILVFIVMFILTLIFGAALGGMGALSPSALESGAAGAETLAGWDIAENKEWNA